jgi:hypothetical protein
LLERTLAKAQSAQRKRKEIRISQRRGGAEEDEELSEGDEVIK